MAECVRLDSLWKCETCFYHKGGECSTWCDAGESYRPAYSVLQFSAFEAEPVVHGRWKETKSGFRCSQCKREPGRHPTKPGAFLSKFCPNCGAKMDADNLDAENKTEG